MRPKSAPLEARITSDGTPSGTRVWVGERELTNVQHVTWDLDVGDQYATATITLGLVEVQATGRADVQAGPSPDDRRPRPRPPATPRHRPST